MTQEWKITESKTGFHAQKMVEGVAYESARFDTKQEAETYINTKINQEIAEEAMEEAQEWINEAKEKEEQTMNTNTKKYSFEIRQIDALNYGEDEGWIWNTSYNMGEMVTKAKDEKKAFTAWMKRHLGISFKPNRTLIEYDGDVYTIIDRKTKEPLFAAIPNC